MFSLFMVEVLDEGVQEITILDWKFYFHGISEG